MAYVSFVRRLAWTVLAGGLLIAGPSAWAESGPLRSGRFRPASEPENVCDVVARFTAPDGDRPAELFITATVKRGWHIQSITQQPGGPLPTRIKLTASSEYRTAGDFQPDYAPQAKREEVFDNLLVETHQGQVTWHAPITISPGVDLAGLQIRGAVNVQPCDANNCLPPTDYAFTAKLGPTPEVALVPTSVSPAAGTPDNNPSSAAGQAAAATFDPAKLQIAADQQFKQQSLLGVMLFGFLGGVILNLMPCVLPVIGLKILSFVEQSGHNRQQAFTLNLWYSLGLMSVFLLLALLAAIGGIGWGQLFTYDPFNIALASVVFAMALSFLGVWEIPIPGFVGRGKANQWAEKEGIAGAFSKGVLTTILATPCTAPFMGSALFWAVGQPAPKVFAVFLSIGLGMASPYLLIGAFPGLIRFLPRPGAWMETFKQIMGFVLLGTVVYILTFIDWPAVVPTIGLLFSLWAACWWIGRTPWTADLSTRVRAGLEGATFVALMGILLFPGMNKVLPGRYSFGGLYEEMSRRFAGSQSENELPWQPFSRAAFEQVVAQRKTVLVDFTADWCMTCKGLEKYVLNTPEVRQAVVEGRVVPLVADWTHRDPEVTEMLDLLGGKQVPVLAIFPADRPNQPVVLRGGYTSQMLLDALRQAGPSK